MRGTGLAEVEWSGLIESTVRVACLSLLKLKNKKSLRKLLTRNNINVIINYKIKQKRVATL